MSGIGFALRTTWRRGGLIEPTTMLGRGAVIAAGPWIFTVLSIAAIHRGTAAFLPQQDGYAFRGLVIYAFALSLLATAPVVNVAVRQVADDLYLRDFQEVGPRYVAALLSSAASSLLVATVAFAAIFRLSGLDLLVSVAGTTVVGLIWPTLAFCGAVRDYAGITAGFLTGLLASVLATVLVAYAGWGPAAMMTAFTAGLGVVFFVLANRVLVTFPDPVARLGRPLAHLMRALAAYWMLALGSAAAIAALWIDKWIMWFGPHGVALQNGLVSAPFYDGALFVAYLTMIPALGLFVTAIETTFIPVYQGYYEAIRERGTLLRIARARAAMEKRAYRLIGRVLTTQAILCLVMAMTAPSLVSLVGLQFQQIGVLRFGLIATLFQFLFLAATSFLLFLDRHGRFLALQLLFLACQIVFTLVTIRLGPQYSGFGHLAACVAASLAAVLVLDRTFARLDYLTFAAAVRQARAPRARVARSPAIAREESRSFDIPPRLPGGRPRPLLAP